MEKKVNQVALEYSSIISTESYKEEIILTEIYTTFDDACRHFVAQKGNICRTRNVVDGVVGSVIGAM